MKVDFNTYALLTQVNLYLTWNKYIFSLVYTIPQTAWSQTLHSSLLSFKYLSPVLYRIPCVRLTLVLASFSLVSQTSYVNSWSRVGWDTCVYVNASAYVCVGEQRVKSVPRHFKVAQWPGKKGSHVFNGMLTDDANRLECEFPCIYSALFTCFRFHVSHQSYWGKRQMKYENYARRDKICITSHENIM